MLQLQQITRFAQCALQRWSCTHRSHDENIWRCLARILQIDPAQCSNEVRESATLALTLGRFGPQKCRLNASACFLGKVGRLSSNDFGETPAVAAQLIDQLEGHPVTPISRAASDSAHQVTGVRELSHPLGGRWGMGPDLRRANQTSLNSAGVETGGSTMWHRELKKHFGMFSSPG